MSVYGWIWRHLPGPAPVRVLLCLVLATAAVAFLFFVGFPALDNWLGLNDVAVR